MVEETWICCSCKERNEKPVAAVDIVASITGAGRDADSRIVEYFPGGNEAEHGDNCNRELAVVPGLFIRIRLQYKQWKIWWVGNGLGRFANTRSFRREAQLYIFPFLSSYLLIFSLACLYLIYS
jgi:hypothetical protein